MVDDAEVEALGWEEEENNLVAWLDDKKREPMSSARDEWSISIPGVGLKAEGSCLAVYVDSPSTTLLQLPLVDPDFAGEDHDMRHIHIRDPLMACYVLQDAGRMDLSVELRVSTVAADDATMLPFRVSLTIVVSLLRPAIFKPIIFTTKTAISEVEKYNLFH